MARTMTTAPTSQTMLFMCCSSSMKGGTDPSCDATKASNCGAEDAVQGATVRKSGAAPHRRSMQLPADEVR